MTIIERLQAWPRFTRLLMLVLACVSPLGLSACGTQPTKASFPIPSASQMQVNRGLDSERLKPSTSAKLKSPSN